MHAHRHAGAPEAEHVQDLRLAAVGGLEVIVTLPGPAICISVAR